MILKFKQGNIIRIVNDTFYDYRSGEKVETQLSQEEIIKLLDDEFQIDPTFYLKAKSYLENN